MIMPEILTIPVGCYIPSSIMRIMASTLFYFGKMAKDICYNSTLKSTLDDSCSLKILFITLRTKY